MTISRTQHCKNKYSAKHIPVGILGSLNYSLDFEVIKWIIDDKGTDTQEINLSLDLSFLFVYLKNNNVYSNINLLLNRI